ncbi:protein shisa-7 [Protopterus annectens]|uniref:protein shisa-7 n=1 Tax=Protopterus annectens TaxID=7888 RepID=UPI001CFA7289|nr:protein shisa-7 [Protopterus annectens]
MSRLITVLIYVALDILSTDSAAVRLTPGSQNNTQPKVLSPLLAHIKQLSKPSNGTALREAWNSALKSGDLCIGYYDVMGQYDSSFNCSTGTFIFCCGTCQYRFCCDDRNDRLDQSLCTNYVTPGWITKPHSTTTRAPGVSPNNGDSKDQSSSTVYVICGVISFTLAIAIGVKIVFNKVSHRPHPRDINVPRALVDILRHQAVPMNHPERNNSLSIGSSTQDNGPSRISKNHYTPIKPVKSNPNNQHQNFIHMPVNSPKHSATIDRFSHMNNIQIPSVKYNSLMSSRSFHNLSQMPPSYETAVKSDINRYSSLKRLAAEKDLDDYYTKRRHLAELTRGTLPLHVMRMNYEHDTYREKSQNPRRVMSQEHILSDDHMPTYNYTISRDRVVSHERLLSREALHSQERLLSPDRTLHRSNFHGGHLSNQKALSQTNVCASTPMLDRHHMIKMNSHPTSANSPKTTWDMGNQTTSRRQAFAAKHQNTIEQLQFIPGHHPSSQHYRTSSKNEVTV